MARTTNGNDTPENAPENTPVTPSNEVRLYQKLQKDLAALASLDAQNGNFDIAAAVIDGIMAAETADDVFAANDSGPLDVREYIGVPLTVFDLMYRKSDAKYAENGGLGFYVVFDAHTDNGEVVKMSTGAPNLVASFRKLQTLGYCQETNPLRVAIRGKETANGTLLTLGKPTA